MSAIPRRLLTIAGLVAFTFAFLTLGWADEPARPQPKTPPILWKTQIGAAGVSAPPAISGNTIVAGTGMSGTQLVGVDLASGRKDWETALKDNGVGATVVDKDQTYVTTESCTIYSIATKTGKIVWSKWLGDPVLSSPAIVGDRIYVGSGQSPDGHLHLLCLAKNSGGEVWRSIIPSEITATPTVADGKVLVALNDGSLRAYKLDGHPLWNAAIGAASPPVVAKAGVFVNTRGGRELACLDPDTGKTRWTRPLGGAPAERTVTTPSGGANLYSMSATPVPAGSRLYVGAEDGSLSCLRADDGGEIWRRPLIDNGTNEPLSAQKAMMAAAVSTPVVTHGKVYVGTGIGRVFCLDADQGQVVWQLDTQGAIRWSPLVYQGKIYFTTDAGELYCADTGDPLASGWTQWGGNASHTMDRHGARDVVSTDPDEEETVETKD